MSKSNPSIIRLKELESGHCCICELTTSLAYFDKELASLKNEDGRFCAGCLPFVQSADYALNKTEGYARPPSK